MTTDSPTSGATVSGCSRRGRGLCASVVVHRVDAGAPWFATPERPFAGYGDARVRTERVVVSATGDRRRRRARDDRCAGRDASFRSRGRRTSSFTPWCRPSASSASARAPTRSASATCTSLARRYRPVVAIDPERVLRADPDLVVHAGRCALGRPWPPARGGRSGLPDLHDVSDAPIDRRAHPSRRISDRRGCTRGDRGACASGAIVERAAARKPAGAPPPRVLGLRRHLQLRFRDAFHRHPAGARRRERCRDARPRGIRPRDRRAHRSVESRLDRRRRRPRPGRAPCANACWRIPAIAATRPRGAARSSCSRTTCSCRSRRLRQRSSRRPVPRFVRWSAIVTVASAGSLPMTRDTRDACRSRTAASGPLLRRRRCRFSPASRSRAWWSGAHTLDVVGCRATCSRRSCCRRAGSICSAVTRADEAIVWLIRLPRVLVAARASARASRRRAR